MAEWYKIWELIYISDTRVYNHRPSSGHSAIALYISLYTADIRIINYEMRSRIKYADYTALNKSKVDNTQKAEFKAAWTKPDSVIVI